MRRSRAATSRWMFRSRYSPRALREAVAAFLKECGVQAYASIHHMTRTRRAILWVAALLIVGTGLFPPWVIARYPVAAGYAWLFQPPWGARVDFDRLVIEWFVIAAIGAALFWAWPSDQTWRFFGRISQWAIQTAAMSAVGLWWLRRQNRDLPWPVALGVVALAAIYNWSEVLGFPSLRRLRSTKKPRTSV